MRANARAPRNYDGLNHQVHAVALRAVFDLTLDFRLGVVSSIDP